MCDKPDLIEFAMAVSMMIRGHQRHANIFINIIVLMLRLV